MDLSLWRNFVSILYPRLMFLFGIHQIVENKLDWSNSTISWPFEWERTALPVVFRRQFSTHMHVFNGAFNYCIHWVTFYVDNCNWFISCLWMQIHTSDISLHSQWWAVLWKLSHWIPIILQIIPRQMTLSSRCESFLWWIFDAARTFSHKKKKLFHRQKRHR